MDPLDAAIASAARALSEGHIERLAQTLDGLSGPGGGSSAILEAAAAVGIARAHAEALASAWEGRPGLPGVALALALRSAALATVGERADETLEVAWTGPSTPSVPVRHTAPILLDLIDGSRKELLVVSFAAYKVPAVIEALTAAATRGVEVRLVLESAIESGGALTFDAKDAFAVLNGRVKFYSWPMEQRGGPSGPRGTLHAKAVIADAERALVTSANITGHALEVNMELGLLVEGGPVPARLASHFAELMARGILHQLA